MPLSFLAEVPSQALTSWVCCRQILNQSIPCPVPCAASAEGLQAIRERGNAIFQELPAHYYLHHDSVSLL